MKDEPPNGDSKVVQHLYIGEMPPHPRSAVQTVCGKLIEAKQRITDTLSNHQKTCFCKRCSASPQSSTPGRSSFPVLSIA